MGYDENFETVFQQFVDVETPVGKPPRRLLVEKKRINDNVFIQIIHQIMKKDGKWKQKDSAGRLVLPSYLEREEMAGFVETLADSMGLEATVVNDWVRED